MSEEQHEDLGAADDEASSSPAPKESTGGSSTPVGIATPPDEERETGKDDESGGLHSARGVNGTAGSSSASEAKKKGKQCMGQLVWCMFCGGTSYGQFGMHAWWTYRWANVSGQLYEHAEQG